MQATRGENGEVELVFAIREGEALAEKVVHRAEDLPSSLLDLANLLREAGYNARNRFRQPPHAWDPEGEPPPSV